MDLNSLFDSVKFEESLSIDALASKGYAESDSYSNILYKPSIKKEKTKHYKSILKFLPWYKDFNNSIIQKYEVFLKNATTDEMKSIDCPSTVGKPSILQDVFFELKNSNNAMEASLSKEFKRRAVYYAPVQIIKDEQHPELEGEIKIFQFGLKIYEKIKDVMKPSNDLIDKNIPFDLNKGKLFSLDIQEIAQYPNYDKSQFIDKTFPFLLINGEKVGMKTPDDIEKIKKFLVDNTPEFEKFEYTEWSADDVKFVRDVILSHIHNSKIIGKLKAKFPSIFRLSEAGSVETLEDDVSTDDFLDDNVDTTLDDNDEVEIDTEEQDETDEDEISDDYFNI